MRELPWPVLLDSAAGGSRLGRWSYVAADPYLRLASKDGRIASGERSFTGDPFAVLQRACAHYRLDHNPALPPFQTGAIGWFGYDLAHHLERLPRPVTDDLTFPDLAVGFYDTVLAFDGQERRAWLMSSGWPEATPEASMHRRKARADRFAGLLAGAIEPGPVPEPAGEVRIGSNFTRVAYEATVQRIIDYILAGDIFQANLTQRFRARLPSGLSPFALHRELMRINPAPFAAYLNMGDTVIASASPERFLKLGGGWVETRPIKGTRPRGRDAGGGRAARRRAPAQREGQGRECDDRRSPAQRSLAGVPRRQRRGTGIVRPRDLSHGLPPGLDRGGPDAARPRRHRPTAGGFPGRLDHRRAQDPSDGDHLRAGADRRAVPIAAAIGWIGFDGDMDTSITIRTYAIKDGWVTFQAGGGIVADSDPAAEYEESLAKAKALMDALKGVP